MGQSTREKAKTMIDSDRLPPSAAHYPPDIFQSLLPFCAVDVYKMLDLAFV
jgi:hypothetical protein